MARTKVVVEGGGRNLYFVQDSGGVFKVFKHRDIGSDEQIGTARSMNDAIDRIENHAGRRVKSIG